MATCKKSAIQNPDYRIVGDGDVESGRGRTAQIGWYAFASNFCDNETVLDVGCGLGEGLKILAKKARKAQGIDIDERLKGTDVSIMRISEVETKSVDVVTVIDAIEHIENDLEFIEDLIRVARRKIIITTPNYATSRCAWPYHIREYMPHELANLFSGKGKIDLYSGTPTGDKIFRVKYLSYYFLFNKLRLWPVTGFFTRCLNKIMPDSMKIQDHLFMSVLLESNPSQGK